MFYFIEEKIKMSVHTRLNQEYNKMYVYKLVWIAWRLFVKVENISALLILKMK